MELQELGKRAKAAEVIMRNMGMKDSTILWKVPIMYLHVCLLVKKLPCGMIMIGGKKKMNMDFLTRSIIT